jgi:predicted AlkP superfamily pyrophosphatase or phosphodiesterase
LTNLPGAIIILGIDKMLLLILALIFLIPIHEAAGNEIEGVSSAEETNKVLLLGVDGATWDIIDPLIESGKLPNIKSLVESGSHGTLVMTEGIIFSPVIWTSMFTGVHPDRHGIIDQQTSLSVFRKQKAVWNYLSDSERPAAVINVPGTFPSDPITGCLISGFPFENSVVGNAGGHFISLRFQTESDSLAVKSYGIVDTDKDSIHTFTITSDIISRKNNYQIKLSHNNTSHEVLISDDTWSPWLHFQLKTGLPIRTRLRLLGSTDNRDMELYLSPLERVPDSTWTYFHSSILSDEIGQAIDAYNPFEIGWWKAVENPVTLGFLYDHLVENERARVDAGLQIHDLVNAPLFIHILTLTDRIQHTYWPYLEPDYYTQIDSLSISLYGDLVQKSYIEIDQLVGQYLDLADENTTVILVSDHGFCSVDWKYILWETMNNLARTIRSQGIIKGISHRLFGPRDFFKRSNKGVHEEEGVYIISGNHIKKNYRGDQISAVDIAPTILYLIGEKMPDDLDGKILVDIFPSDHLEMFPPSLVDGSYGKKKSEAREIDPSVVEQLKSMGYLE